jgi:chromosome segregation ATPase
MTNDFTRLKSQCDSLKTQRQTLSTECTGLQTDRQSLTQELEKLQAERDSLRMELAKEHDQNAWWASKDMQASGTASMEYDGQGKLKRRIWVLETRNKELEDLVEGLKSERLKSAEESDIRAEKAIADERSVSAGLRERIGRMEEKVRLRDDSVQEVTACVDTLRKTLEAQRVASEQSVAEMQIERQDIREALQKEKVEVERLQGQIMRLKEERQNMQEELRSLRSVESRPTTYVSIFNQYEELISQAAQKSRRQAAQYTTDQQITYNAYQDPKPSIPQYRRDFPFPAEITSSVLCAKVFQSRKIA